jgi:transcriptional regulator with GAF, ATPase, and Fis domain
MLIANVVNLAEIDQLDSLMVPPMPLPRGGAAIGASSLEALGPDDLIGEGIVGRSVALRNVLEQLEMVAPTESTVLICGETGTGKELIARAVHRLSARRTQPFVKCNCAAIPTGLLEAELFGHEKGAFTGAVGQRIGRFELANRGTIFLDEIGEAPLELQPKLLRVLQEREFERLGNSHTLHTDARLVAATNVNLPEMVEAKRFRADLLKETRWVLSGPRGAAARLGINRSTLQFRMKKLGIERPTIEDEATQ